MIMAHHRMYPERIKTLSLEKLGNRSQALVNFGNISYLQDWLKTLEN